MVNLLESRGVTLALAEAGSGGSLAAALSEADNDHTVLVGAYIAPTIEKLQRLLGVQSKKGISSASAAQQVEQLAQATANVANSQMAIAVGEPWLDENGAAYMDVVFKFPDGHIEIRKLRYRGSGETARSRLVTQLLDQLRRKLR